MSQQLEDIIDVISRPPADRSDVDINGILPWLQRRTDLLPPLDQDTAMQLVRFCGYQTAEQDDVIIRQGEEADRMYIILRGSISVYIDPSMTGEEVADPIVSTDAAPHGEPQDINHWKQLDRAHYGRFIIKYESGKHFGEAGLIGEEGTRNATVLAEEHCDLMVIPKDLFDQSLREHQRKQFRRLENFVETHPLFSHMSPKFKQLLALSLRRQDFSFGSTIITQGQRHTALYFILSGQANVFIEPDQHEKQYNHLWPFEAGMDIYAQEFAWLRESRRATILVQYDKHGVWTNKPESLVVKRTEGYAASERLMHDRSVCLCSVGDGEVLGDAEVVQKLDSYMQTVVCTTNTQTLVLDVKNLERVTGKRNTLTLQLLKQSVMRKLTARKRSPQGQQVPFLHFLHTKLTEQELPEKKPLPPLKATKGLPSRDLETQHMLERYLQGKAELVEPCVPGTLIYKDIMEEKARIRSNIRKRSNIGMNAMLRDARRRINRRMPRSRREIVASLKQMIEAELVDTNSEGPVSKSQQQKQPQQVRKDRDSGSVALHKMGSLTPRHILESQSDAPRKLSGDARTPQMPSLSVDPGSARSVLSGDGATSRNLLMQPESTDGPKKSSLATKEKSGSEVKKKVTLPPVENTPKKSHSKTGNAYQLPQILEERENSGPTSAVSSSQSRRYVKREVPASSDGNTPPSGSAKRLPPLAKVELRRPENIPNDRWSTALEFFNERIHGRLTEQLKADGGSSPAFDYETSESSLQLLESRIKNFHVKQGEQFSPVRLNLKLPKLRRFKLDLEDEDQGLPMPGGKVWIKKRLCQFANSKFKVKGHEHVRYHMVPELPEFDKVKKMQTVVTQLMGNTVLKNQVAEELTAEGDLREDPFAGNGSQNIQSEHRASFV